MRPMIGSAVKKQQRCFCPIQSHNHKFQQSLRSKIGTLQLAENRGLNIVRSVEQIWKSDSPV